MSLIIRTDGDRGFWVLDEENHKLVFRGTKQACLEFVGSPAAYPKAKPMGKKKTEPEQADDEFTGRMKDLSLHG